MQRGLIIWGLLVGVALLTAGCDTAQQGTVQKDEQERAKLQTAVEKGAAPTGGPTAPSSGASLPSGYPGEEQAKESAPGGQTGQPNSEELKKLYKRKG